MPDHFIATVVNSTNKVLHPLNGGPIFLSWFCCFPCISQWSESPGLCLLLSGMMVSIPTSRLLSSSVVMARHVLIVLCSPLARDFPIYPFNSHCWLLCRGTTQSHALGKWSRNFTWPRSLPIPTTRREPGLTRSLNRFFVGVGGGGMEEEINRLWALCPKQLSAIC